MRRNVGLAFAGVAAVCAIVLAVHNVPLTPTPFVGAMPSTAVPAAAVSPTRDLVPAVVLVFLIFRHPLVPAALQGLVVSGRVIAAARPGAARAVASARLDAMRMRVVLVVMSDLREVVGRGHPNPGRRRK